MSEPYIGEIRMFGGNFAPKGWAFCNGQVLSISENDALFSLIGTTYGGNGQTTFALPNLQGRLPLHAGSGLSLGQMGGAETVTLTQNQMPAHTHAAGANEGAGQKPTPAGGIWANSTLTQFANVAPDGNMSPQAIDAFGGSQPHDNMMPSLCVSFIISLFGIYPTQN